MPSETNRAREESSLDAATFDALGAGVFDIATRITNGLERFIEAGYHLRDEALIVERQKLLQEYGSIKQKPYIEATPAYRSSRLIEDYDHIPPVVRDALQVVSSYDLGLYNPPYDHQGQAIDAFFAGSDLAVATGTGSGKTEAFLASILGSLVLEAKARPTIATMRGVRALLLYPMNALVNDQVFRIRRLFGDPRVADMLAERRERRVTFASYTSRTPYHGRRTSKKDRWRVGNLLETYYLKLQREQPEIVDELRGSGRWPVKDLNAFFAGDLALYDRNGKMRDGRWSQRLITGERDVELMTRHEVLAQCPDILVTNYSMLEYMLLRPFERPVFKATASWLHADPDNQLIIVLDEAHLYRGAAGAEVSLLLRRLAGRLGINRDRIRFILTTASFGEGANSNERIQAFASALTGVGQEAASFAIVRGTPESPQLERHSLSTKQITALAALDLKLFQSLSVETSAAQAAMARLATTMDWTAFDPAASEIASYLGTELRRVAEVETLIGAVAGRAVPLEELPNKIFPESVQDPGIRRAATAALIALCSAARFGGRSLLPVRMHLFYRGLPGLFACSSKECDARRSQEGNAPLGRLYAEARLVCQCSDRARVFEVLSHRDCGAAFLRGYVENARGGFVWNEAGSGARRIFSAGADGHAGSRLLPIEMLVDGEPHPDAEQVTPAWLDIKSGKLVDSETSTDSGFRKVWVPQLENPEERGVRFKPCPVCLRDWRENQRNEGLALSKIEPHGTMGENPFTALTSAQLSSQPENLGKLASQNPDRFPNRGRKVLVFSDGRQKAARLARDMPHMVRRDTFRQAIALAVSELDRIGVDASPNHVLYTGLVATLSKQQAVLFPGDAGEMIGADVRRFKRDYGIEYLSNALLEGAFTPSAEEYSIAVLEQIGGRYYSLTDATVGWVEPTRRVMRTLIPQLGAIRSELDSNDNALPLVYAWMGTATDGYAIDERIPARSRARAAGFGENRSDWSASGKFRSAFRKSLARDLAWTSQDVEAVESGLTEAFMHGAEKHYLNPATIRVRVDLEQRWYRCRECFIIEPMTLLEYRCTHCGASAPESLEPSRSNYLRARKGYWRDPVIAAVRDGAPLVTLAVAEHTAQLGHREYDEVQSTTERHEFAFQDILIDPRDTPVDVLSCTTTMEVGVDIGALVAVGLRNIPPERSNYQQRAGRAGRRGNSVATVVTYGDRGPHGTYYFRHPEEIVAGPVKDPDVRVNNAKLARRHVHAILIQNYVAGLTSTAAVEDASIETSLGRTEAFFCGADEPSLEGFGKWTQDNVISDTSSLASQVASWLPSTLELEADGSSQTVGDLSKWVREVALDFVSKLEILRGTLPKQSVKSIDKDPEVDADDADDSQVVQHAVSPFLLGFLFDANLLPTYAFPTDLASFMVDDAINENGYTRVRVREMPQQAMSKAITEYAPGRLIVIDTATYRSGGVTARTPFNEIDRARPLFEQITHIVACDDCGYLRVAQDLQEAGSLASQPCRTCGAPLAHREMIQPEVFVPEGRDELPDDDREQDITYATTAQFPLPADGDDRLQSALRTAGAHFSYTHAVDQELITLNKGLGQGFQANQGFYVCTRCGKASIDVPRGRRHSRNYHIQGRSVLNERFCDGVFRQVVLGHRFVSDVLLLRITIRPPLITDLTSSLSGRIMEDALSSAAEALLIAAARSLDLDPQEFGVGYRIVPRMPGAQLGSWELDIYLYDTLSGGAGYAEMASRALGEIVESALYILEGCDCQRSCTRCLRHYRNQYVQGKLDRSLGASLLRWGRDGKPPPSIPIDVQAEKLIALQRLLELEGLELMQRSDATGQRIEVRNPRNQRSAWLAVWPALLAREKLKADSLLLSEYTLARDLPYEHEIVRRFLSVD